MTSTKIGSGFTCVLMRAGAAAFPVAALALVCGIQPALASALTLQDVVNPNDVTFNQELGINNSGTIAGYFGSGMAGHPNQGYTTTPPYTSFTPENFPMSVQTQVTGINNIGTTVGFYSFTNMGVGLDANFGFVDVGGMFTDATDPAALGATLVTDQLLGVNDSDIAVGFYTNAAGNTVGYTYNIASKAFSGNIVDPNGNGTNTTSAAINNSGELAGFFTSMLGTTEGFLDNSGTFTTVDVPGSMETELLGLNNTGEAVGVDIDAAGIMHGIICNTATLSCTQVDDPNGIGTTTLNGLNDKGQVVGFYVNGADSTIGLVASPVPEPSTVTLLLSGLIGLGVIYWRRRRTV
jgi:hypothetical protein